MCDTAWGLLQDGLVPLYQRVEKNAKKLRALRKKEKREIREAGKTQRREEILFNHPYR
jgi:hypothetical protein